MLRTTSQQAEVLATGAGVARVSQQVAEALTRSSGKARVSQQVAEVLLSTTEFPGDGSGTLTLADAVDYRGPVYVQVHHVVHLEQTGHGVAPIRVSVQDTLALVQRGGRTLAVTVSDSLALTDSGGKTDAVDDALALVQTASIGKGATVHCVLSLLSEAIPGGVFRKTVSHGLGLIQSGTYQLDGPCVLRQYTPFVGFGDGTTPGTSAPALADAILTLTHPFVAPTRTVTLRNPNFHNRDRLGFNRINRESRGGTLVVFADPSWPKTQTLQIEVSGLTRQQVADLMDFFAASLGQEIGLLDHENRQWRGVILNPDTPFADLGCSDRMVSFEFEGELA